MSECKFTKCLVEFSFLATLLRICLIMAAGAQIKCAAIFDFKAEGAEVEKDIKRPRWDIMS